MEIEATLQEFLRSTVAKSRRDRLIEFASKPKTRPKFLDLMYHDMGSLFDSSVTVEALPEEAWSQPGLAFAPPATFGAPYPTLRDAFDAHANDDTGCLIITLNGEFGAWFDHTYVDTCAFVRVPARGAA